jgi:hypothetical protein
MCRREGTCLSGAVVVRGAVQAALPQHRVLQLAAELLPDPPNRSASCIRAHLPALSLSLLHPLVISAVQDEVVRLAPSKRGGERGAAEKKIAILEKALSLHPGSDELLLALLKAVSKQCDSGGGVQCAGGACVARA